MLFQEYQAEGITSTPAKARLAATMNVWVRSVAAEPGVRYCTKLTITRIAAVPNKSTAARVLNTSCRMAGHWIDGRAVKPDGSVFDISNIPPEAGVVTPLLEITAYFSSIVTLRI